MPRASGQAEERNMFDDLKGKSVLITGSSTGIGAAVAKGFGRVGARVTVHGNANPDKANEVAAEIRKSGGWAIVALGDIMKTDVVARVIQRTVDAFGGLDVLINNAGSLYRRAPLEKLDDDMYDNVTDLNIGAVVTACRLALPHLRKSGGCIINTGSAAGHNGGGVGIGLYAGAKGFVHAWTRNLALELGPEGIRVNCVSPGVIQTAFHKTTPPERLEAIRNMIPLKRLGTAEDCVGIYLFLASNALAGYIHGQAIEVNGGQYFK